MGIMNREEINSYKNALVEVTAVLDCLEYDAYKKIPDDIIQAIDENKNKDYEFYYDEDLDYGEWNLSNEAKALLYSIYRRYIANEDEKKYFEEKEKFERNKLEREKQEKYNPSELFKKNADNSKLMETSLVEVKKEKWYNRIWNKISKLLRR